MKFSLVLIVILVVKFNVARILSSNCDDDDDCNSNECCKVKGYIPFRKGRCVPLRDLHERCSTGLTWSVECDCKETYTCVGYEDNGGEEVRFGTCKEKNDVQQPLIVNLAFD